ncbi:MAG: glycosyltransferase [Candidatus Anammoxibacter sp.]
MKPFTIFIPVYNEEELIVRNTEKLISYLRGFNTPFEVLIGSNGSRDATVRLGNELQEKYSEVSFFHVNERGAGGSFKKGIKLASYNDFISLDMDLSIDMSFVKETVILLEHYDIVIGSKKLGTQKRSFMRRLASDSFIFFAKFLLDLDYVDYSIAAKAYKKDVIERYLDKCDSGTSYVLQVIYFAYKDGFKIIEIAVACDDNRKSKFNLLNEGLYKYKSLIRLWLFGK